ncbi:hypothetical protein CAL7716_059660 [Calothrix sp. PCC 7716]|nr:hypothetical protein CAL7716_059660 [Calothrix sp. PCC 7716]
MITQFQELSITSLNELVVSPSLFNDLMNDANDVVHPMGAIYTSTVQLLRYSSWLAEQKAKLTKQEYKDLLRQMGWESEEKAYLKVDAAFNVFAPYQLAQIEPRTIFLIALNLKKYQSVITQMQSLPIITQDKVRGFMKKCHKARAKKESGEATIWRMMPDTKRACVIGPIYNQAAGVMLEEMVKAQGRTGESITEQAIIYFYENEFKKSAEIINVAETVTETTACEAPIVGVETAPQDMDVSFTSPAAVEAPQEEVVNENQTAPSVSEVASNFVHSWDEDLVVVEDMEVEETSEYNPWNIEDSVADETWSFELEEDFIEDYELLTTQSQTLAPHQELVQALQAATCWQEISVAFNTHEQYKYEAWNALTDVERRQILDLTPPAILKLSNAKRDGLIGDFRFEREGVYQVRENANLPWDIVFEHRLDDYLARL